MQILLLVDPDEARAIMAEAAVMMFPTAGEHVEVTTLNVPKDIAETGGCGGNVSSDEWSSEEGPPWKYHCSQPGVTGRR